jgi:hypothetical protein
MNDLWDRLAKEVAARDLLTFPGSIRTEGPTAMWPADMPLAQFLDLARKLEAKVVYLDADTMSDDALFELVASTLEEPGIAYEHETFDAFLAAIGIRSHKLVAEYLSYGKARLGQRSTITAEWSYGGVIHRYLAVADWYGRLLDMASGLGDLIDLQVDDS